MQLAPSGLNITKCIVIQNVKEYCDSIKANLDKHEIMDIFLHHKKYTVEFQDYIRMIKYITLVWQYKLHLTFYAKSVVWLEVIKIC